MPGLVSNKNSRKSESPKSSNEITLARAGFFLVLKSLRRETIMGELFVLLQRKPPGAGPIKWAMAVGMDDRKAIVGHEGQDRLIR